MSYDVDDKEDWVLSEFIDKLKQPPSKLCIYLMYQPETLSVSCLHNIKQEEDAVREQERKQSTSSD